MILQGKWLDEEMLIIGVYAPHTSQSQFWMEIFDVLSQKEVLEMIILGDFNATIFNALDRSINSNSRELPKLFREYKEAFQLVDIWRMRNPDKRDYTYFSKPHMSHSRIDYIMSSPGIADKVTLANICTHSNHASMSIKEQL